MISSEIWVILLVLLVTVLWAIFVIQVPRTLRSLFRYRLWAIRDAVVDDVLRGDLPKSPLVDDDIRQIECIIANSEAVTFLQFLVLPRPPKKYVEARNAFRTEEFKKLTEKQQAVVRGYTDALQWAVLRHLLFGSFAGWTVLGLLATIAFVVAVLAAARTSAFSIARLWKNTKDWVRSFGGSQLQPDRVQLLVDVSSKKIGRDRLVACQ
ncbi:MAG: hypothetical protein ACYTFA_09655 [Planctomycetota bacterium]|jgi:hypothetical protein